MEGVGGGKGLDEGILGLEESVRDGGDPLVQLLAIHQPGGGEEKQPGHGRGHTNSTLSLSASLQCIIN